MNYDNSRAIISGAPDLVTCTSARLEDVLQNPAVSEPILQKYYHYWQVETEASQLLVEAFTHLNYGYLQAVAIPAEVKRRHQVANEQILLYEQEIKPQAGLER